MPCTQIVLLISPREQLTVTTTPLLQVQEVEVYSHRLNNKISHHQNKVMLKCQKSPYSQNVRNPEIKSKKINLNLIKIHAAAEFYWY